MSTMELEKLSFYDCCRAVLKAAHSAKQGSLLQYAATYAEAGLRMSGKDEIRTQAIYILSNTQVWRGDEARNVKIRLRQFAEGKE